MKEIKITSNGIKQAIDDLVDENERLQDKVYKLEDIIKEVREYITRKDICIDTRKTDGSLDYVDLKKELLEILDKENRI